MIKVIASDMDGTLLDEDHRIASRTLEAIRRVRDMGIHFVIVTGRSFNEAVQVMGDRLFCDCILNSGAEVRNSQRQVVSKVLLEPDLCEEIHRILEEYPVSVIFMTDEFNYIIGTQEEVEEGFAQSMQLFFPGMGPEELRQTEMYQKMKGNTRPVSGIRELRERNIPVYKLFLFLDQPEVLTQIRERLTKDPRLAVTSSFAVNLEVTDVRAQKGPVLKDYIESLGYTMDEVMVLGDSMNDYSMLSMDFGATIAMGNAVPEVKAVSKYVAKSNEEFGVACVLEEMVNRRAAGRD